MKSFLIAATIALVGSSMIVDTASARSKRSAPSMAGFAAMAPVALAAGAALINSGGYVGSPIVTPYGTIGPVNTYVDPVILPDVHVPTYSPGYVPSGFGLPGMTQEIGG